jgi:glycosyltransferase involved in cell wall biosynthesis
MKISILIPCHNEEDAIQACLESCLRQTRMPDEIVVVNDGSTDRTASILEDYRGRIKIATIANATGNKSYAQEFGLQYITGDILIMTDGDTSLDRNFVARVVPHFDDEHIAAVCGYVKSIKHNWLTACREIEYSAIYLALSLCALTFPVSLYAYVIRGRLDLIKFAPFSLVPLLIRAWIFVEQFIYQIILRKKDLVWHKPPRRPASYPMEL